MDYCTHVCIVATVPPFNVCTGCHAAVLEFFILQAVGLSIETLFLQTPGRDIALYQFGLQYEQFLGRVWTFGWLLFAANGILGCLLGDRAATGAVVNGEK